MERCASGAKVSRENTIESGTGNKRWVPHCPDFLRRLMALIHPMRLSLMKGAHADPSSTPWQEIGVKPFFGLSGIVALDRLATLSRPYGTQCGEVVLTQTLKPSAFWPIGGP